MGELLKPQLRSNSNDNAPGYLWAIRDNNTLPQVFHLRTVELNIRRWRQFLVVTIVNLIRVLLQGEKTWQVDQHATWRLSFSTTSHRSPPEWAHPANGFPNSADNDASTAWRNTGPIG